MFEKLPPPDLLYHTTIVLSSTKFDFVKNLTSGRSVLAGPKERMFDCGSGRELTRKNYCYVRWTGRKLTIIIYWFGVDK